jgi:membrane-bound lytic murein transglycosylase D
MSWVEVLRWYVAVQVLVVAATGLVAVASRLRLAPAGVLWTGRVLAVAVLFLPLAVALVPVDAPFHPPAQVWSGLGDGAPTMVAVAPGDTFAAQPLTASADVLGFAAVVLALGALVGLGRVTAAWFTLRRQIRASVCWRRVGAVDVRVAHDASAPFAVHLGGRAVVMLDDATYLDPADRLMAVRHELQHHRQGDTRFAYVMVALRALCFFNPAVHLWVRRMEELEELACDAALVRHRGVSPLDYGTCLVRAARHAATPLPLAAGLAPGASRSLLYRRIQMLNTPRPPRFITLAPVVLMVTALLVATAWGADNLIDDLRLDRARVTEVALRASAPEFTVPVNDEVLDMLDRYAGREKGRRFLRRGLEESVGYEDLVREAIGRHGLPPQLAAVPLIESRYENMPPSSAETTAPGTIMGAGLWMFIPDTARVYGLQVDDERDDRLDEELETEAAMELLGDLYDQFGDWGLALAGYNQGARRVREAIEREGTADVWELMRAGALNDYVARIMVGVLVMEEPSLVGAR